MPQVQSTLLDQFPDKLLDLIQQAPLPGIDTEPKCKATAQRIEELRANSSVLRGSLTEAGLWLLAGELDLSHEVSQGLETAEGSYWHGIMHRREGDFWNSKYWFRKVGQHPVMEQLANYLGSGYLGSGYLGSGYLGSGENAIEIAESTPLPIRDLSSPTKVSATLVDCCERALSSKPEQVSALQRVCWLEWQFLFLYGCDNST